MRSDHQDLSTVRDYNFLPSCVNECASLPFSFDHPLLISDITFSSFVDPSPDSYCLRIILLVLRTIVCTITSFASAISGFCDPPCSREVDIACEDDREPFQKPLHITIPYRQLPSFSGYIRSEEGKEQMSVVGGKINAQQ